ncbi:hypothetical protein Daesc_009490 [Daldinia eschscholtzii]|uniref:Uncharacterized protein n=1 Tax=Daldinia eschscholtzii TaxID=292717 RepID=A0AAX6MAC5_9PEZI
MPFSSFTKAQEGQQSESRNRNNEIVQNGCKSAKILTGRDQATKFEEERLGSWGKGKTRRIIKVLFENITRRFEKDANDPQCHSIQDSDLNLTRPTLAQEIPAASERVTPFHNPFDDPLTIPYIKNQEPVYFYQHAERRINDSHVRRYGEIINIFQTSIESNPKLAASRDWVEKITYSLAMCGTNIANAKESIIVFCPSSDELVRQLTLTLSQKHILDQYACGHVEVCYQLYIWREAYKYIGETEESVTILFNKEQSLCGSPVTNVDGKVRLSTVACIISIDFELFALTSGHPFKHRAEPENDPDLPISPQSEPITDIVDGILPHNVEYQDRLPGRKVFRHSSRVARQENFDWSLITLPQDLNIGSCENSFLAVESQQFNRDIHYISYAPKSRFPGQRRVRIILPYNTESKGIIRLQIGDSGSLVVDMGTDEAYGHVIAVDPIGRILVVPLADTLRQIAKVFQTYNVKFFPRHVVDSMRLSDEATPQTHFYYPQKWHESWIRKLFKRIIK